MQWYKIMTAISGVPILIAVIVLSYKLMVGGFSIEKRREAKDNILRLFFGGVAIALAPLFIKLMLYINNGLVKILVLRANGSLDDLLGNSLLTNVRTGNAILTSLVIAMFAYLFIKLNVKFIIRQFTILIFTIFTPIVATLWIMNRRAIGASIWFGQILINTFMQFIYAFLFLVYLNFLPASGGWAISLLWALMILPLADALQNTLQNLVSRVAGIQNEELANRGIGMAAEMAYTVKAFAYQFKGGQANGETSGLLQGFMNKTSIINENKAPSHTTPVETKIVETNPVQTKPIEPKNTGTTKNEQKADAKSNSASNMNKTSPFGMAAKVGGAFLNTGRYIAEGKSFGNSKNESKEKNRNEDINNIRIEAYKRGERPRPEPKIKKDENND